MKLPAILKVFILALLLVSTQIFAQTKTATTPATPASTATQTQADNPNAPEISFKTLVIDYGEVEYDSDGMREFEFTNTGKEPLIITTCKGSCGCTVPTWPKEPIPPGGKGVIKVKYDTKRGGQPFTKTVTVTSNAKTPTTQLKITGKVKPNPNAAQPQEDLTPVKKTNPDGSPVENH